MKKYAWQGGPVAVVIGVGLLRGLAGTGWTDWRAWARWFAASGLLVVGWAAGWVLPEVIVRPEVRKWLPKEIGESLEPAIWNVVTALSVAVAGVWVISSAGSPLAAGLVAGLSVRMFATVVRLKDHRNWYWLFKREFNRSEHRVVMGVWGVLLAGQLWLLIRG